RQPAAVLVGVFVHRQGDALEVLPARGAGLGVGSGGALRRLPGGGPRFRRAPPPLLLGAGRRPAGESPPRGGRGGRQDRVRRGPGGVPSPSLETLLPRVGRRGGRRRGRPRPPRSAPRPARWFRSGGPAPTPSPGLGRAPPPENPRPGRRRAGPGDGAAVRGRG